MLAIDPGSVESAWVLLDQEAASGISMPVQPVVNHDKPLNKLLLELLRDGRFQWYDDLIVVIEWMTPRGMPTSADEFETLYWIGRYAEAAEQAGFRAVVRLPRAEVKLAICGSPKANDANIIAALKDRFGGAAAKGTKAAPGPLYGIRADEWQALALGLAYLQWPVDELEEAF